MERLLLECSVRALLVAAATAAILPLLRVKSAAARHAAWTGVLLVTLLLPAWTEWGPKAAVRVLPPPSIEEPPVSAPIEAPAAAAVANFTSGPTPEVSRWNWNDALVGVYLLGAGWLLLRLAIGTVRANRLTSAECVAPITVGLLRPRVILPPDSNGWPKERLEAVLAHERAHASRRDPLVQCLALLNRAVFWFHPLAWWLERKLAALAEEACDAAVLESGHDAGEYAECLLAMERVVSAAGGRVAIGMAMPGSALPRRVKQIIEGARPARASKSRMALAGVACMAAAVTFAAGTVERLPQILPLSPIPAVVAPRPPVLLAQTQTPVAPAREEKLEFESASIRPFQPDPNGGFPLRTDGGPGTADPARVEYVNFTLKRLLVAGFNIRESYIQGPSWLDDQRFVIEARLKPGATKEQASEMLRNLLVDRFKIKAHTEAKEESYYEMTLVKMGPKLRDARTLTDEDRASLKPAPGMMLPQDKDGFLVMPRPLPMTGYPFQFGDTDRISHSVGMAATSSDIANYLEFELKKPVVDKAGLKATYDYNLAFARGADANGPAFTTAVREQLGLKLTSKKGPIDVLVIDSIEKIPTAN